MRVSTPGLMALLAISSFCWADDNPRHVDVEAGVSAVKTLPQNWTDEESNRFFLPQASALESAVVPRRGGPFQVPLQKNKVKIGYKARPLNGIWATAPYLHNGSVPNLWELLKPAEDRPKSFHVGSQEFDPVHVGLVNDPKYPLFDTSAAGNANTGHEFGANLSEQDRKDLLEYLKSL